MNMRSTFFSNVWIFLFLSTVLSVSAETAVEKHGWLTAKDGYLLNEKGKIVQLRGMSFYWSTPGWNGAKYYTAGTIDALVDSWKCTVVRVAYDRNNNNDNGWNLCKIVIDQAIKRGIYVIIDWHSHTAENQESASVSFFTAQAQAYKNTPNVIFEPYNEPINIDGSKDGSTAMAKKTWDKIKPYLTNVSKAIRNTGAKNLIIAGTPFYAQHVQIAAADPIPVTNIAYAFHFYAASHGPNAMNVKKDGTGGMEPSYLSGALGKITIFITEWGTTHSDGSQQVDAANTKWWFDNYINGDYHLSWCNWSVSDFEGSSAFGSSGPSSTSASGAVVKSLLTSPTTDTYNLPSENGVEGPAKSSVAAIPGTIAAWNFNRYWGAFIVREPVKFSLRDNKTDVRTAKDTCLRVIPGSSKDWISFAINNSSATKNIFARYLANGGSGSVAVYLDNGTSPVATISIPKSKGWTTVKQTAAIPQGQHTIKMMFPTAADSGFSLAWFEISNNETATLTTKPDQRLSTDIAVTSFNGQLSLHLPEVHNYSSYSLIGIDGRMVQNGRISGNMEMITLDKLVGGMWFLRVNKNNGASFHTTIINN